MTRVNSRSEVAWSNSEGREQPLRGGADRLDLLGELLAERREHVLAVLADQQLVAECLRSLDSARSPRAGSRPAAARRA